MKQAGAHTVIVSETAEKTKIEVMDATQSKGVDIVIETMGSRLGESVDLASHGGRIVVFGTISGAEAAMKIRPHTLRA